MVVLQIHRTSAADANIAEYSVSFRPVNAMGSVLLGRVAGLDALRRLLRSLKLSEPVVEAACEGMVRLPFHEIQGVRITPALIRGLGL
jgi:hypothetical protein